MLQPLHSGHIQVTSGRKGPSSAGGGQPQREREPLSRTRNLGRRNEMGRGLVPGSRAGWSSQLVNAPEQNRRLTGGLAARSGHSAWNLTQATVPNTASALLLGCSTAEAESEASTHEAKTGIGSAATPSPARKKATEHKNKFRPCLPSSATRDRREVTGDSARWFCRVPPHLLDFLAFFSASRRLPKNAGLGLKSSEPAPSKPQADGTPRQPNPPPLRCPPQKAHPFRTPCTGTSARPGRVAKYGGTLFINPSTRRSDGFCELIDGLFTAAPEMSARASPR